MYIMNSNFALVKQIGDLSESRINELVSRFNSRFPEIVRPNEQSIIFKRGVTAVGISPDQIVYMAQDNADRLNSDEIFDLLLEINDVLGLSHKARIVVNMEGTERFERNILEKSRGILGDASDILQADTIGFRFVLTQELFRGDILIEPYLKDNQSVYYAMAFETQQIDLSDDAKKVLGTIFTYSIEKSKEAARNIFSL
ncbi:hypothetical protein COF06_28520 [Bacillus wiedmannii]|uniref:hypothetical protein n=1 Tax=Bacillus wiedmannii TaxID=1890302 RepID=UPI000BFDDC98|nr:hypothetical protein [Bacillus wiedmannii]PHA31847.1 hypothetical protein COF06_28520 [Bacillus wiedmannii]